MSSAHRFQFSRLNWLSWVSFPLGLMLQAMVSLPFLQDQRVEWFCSSSFIWAIGRPAPFSAGWFGWRCCQHIDLPCKSDKAWTVGSDGVWYQGGLAAHSCHRWPTWSVLCEEGRGPRVGEISVGGAVASGRRCCRIIACVTRLCRSWRGIAGCHQDTRSR